MSREAPTLDTLPFDSSWHFVSREIAILCKHDEPLVVNVYGAVKLTLLTHHPNPAVHIRPWTFRDIAGAARLFPGQNDRAEYITATVMYPQDLQNIHPGSAPQTDDIVHLRCHLLLHADPSRAPTYSLHLESVTVLAAAHDD
ncbi:hypothetical protein OH77DRAFT_1439039 [Trametes cingulata]|nr:hypothetical protein OH77DRAFT_1439039 [Trametes cingulata]